jgi:hypothetical protein
MANNNPFSLHLSGFGNSPRDDNYCRQKKLLDFTGDFWFNNNIK